MALNYLGIVSYGSISTYGTSNTERSRLAVSMGLLTFTFPSIVISNFIGNMFTVGHKGIRFLGSMLRIG